MNSHLQSIETLKKCCSNIRIDFHAFSGDFIPLHALRQFYQNLRIEHFRFYLSLTENISLKFLIRLGSLENPDKLEIFQTSLFFLGNRKKAILDFNYTALKELEKYYPEGYKLIYDSVYPKMGFSEYE